MNGRRTKIQGWRKIAAATWGRPIDPQIYGDMKFDETARLGFWRKKTCHTCAIPS